MWFWLALGSSVFGAIDVILNKKALSKVSPVLLSWALFTLTIPILIPIAISQGLPSINSLFIIAVLGSSLTYVFSKTLLNYSLQQSLISKILPLTAFSGLFSYIFGVILLSETIRLIPVLGLCSIVIGSYILNADQAKEDLLKPFKLLFSSKNSILLLISIILAGLTVILDKIGLINTFPQNPTIVMLTEQIVMSLGLTAYLLKKQKDWVYDLKKNFKILFINSLVFLAIGFMIFYAYLDGPAALIIGIKRLQIFFILILGMILFKDKPTKHSWIASAVMVLGVLMIRLG